MLEGMKASFDLAGRFNAVGFLIQQFGIGHLLVNLEPAVKRAPDITKFSDGSENGAFSLVNEVVVLVGALDEVGMVGVDSQLRLTDESVFISEVHQDIVGTLLQPILNPDYLELLRLPVTQLTQMLEKLQYLTLLRGNFTSHQITYLEADEVRRGVPAGTSNQLSIVYTFGHLE